MISEKEFIKRYKTFWDYLIPLGEKFVKDIKIIHGERYNVPIESNVDPNGRALISEISFNLFKEANKKKMKIGRDYPSDLLLKNLIVHSKNAVRSLERLDEIISRDLLQEEIDESLALARLLQEYFAHMENETTMTIHPIIKGCGFIDHCLVDVITGDTLYEIKSGGQPFKIVDIKQIIVYCSLNYASLQYNVKNIAMYNPRLGIYFKKDVDEFSDLVSGRSASDLFMEVIEYVSSGGVSK